MDLTLASADLLLRGGAAALLVFHLAHIFGSRLPRLHRWLLAVFVASVLAYLLCSRPDFASFSWGLKLPALALCLMSAPLLWLAMQVVFDDAFAWSARIALALALTLGLGALAVSRAGGMPVNIAHKMVLIGFAVATLWTIVKDWRSDLVSSRRLLRTWFAGALGGYVLLVLGFELLFAGGVAPRWLELLNLAGIVCLTGLTALVSARHPLDEWLGATKKQAKTELATNQTAPEPAPPPDLTPAPPALDRKAALRDRLLHAMGSQRAYAREGLTLAQLADQLEATPVQLREAINQRLGYRNFNDFLHHYRVDEAAQRLHSQDLPILSIALDVGYGSIGPFNRAFKQLRGLTPSEFRAQKP